MANKKKKNRKFKNTDLPASFLQRLKLQLKEEYGEFIKAISEPYKKSIRLNTNFEPDEYLADDAKAVPWDERGYYVGEELSSLTANPLYAAGAYYLQEASAMAPVNYMRLEKGMRVLDLCAAPGGKSLQISGNIGHSGLLISNDISVSRQRATLRNIEKFGLKNTVVIAENPREIASAYPRFFDAILIDAPCSGEGMFAKDLKYALDWNEDSPKKFAEIQKRILEEIRPALKNGGVIMYSTCTYSQDENEGVIRSFLKEHGDFSLRALNVDEGITESENLKNSYRIWPHKSRGLGHFFALVQQNDTGLNADTKIENTDDFQVYKGGANTAPCAGKDSKLALAFKAFMKENGFMSLWAEDDENYDYFAYKDKLLYHSKWLPRGLKLRTLRSGLLLGELREDKFIPSQHLAMSLNATKSGLLEHVLSFTLNDVNAIKYLRGETLLLNMPAGYVLVLVEGRGLGFALSDGKKLKNLYKRDWVRR